MKEQLIDRFGASKVFGSGFRVYTTINLRLQQIARDAVQKILPSPDGPQAALVSINPTDGSVLAMVGGRNFHVSQYNLATARERQTGSAFKPFVLASALRKGISPLTTYTSKPVSIFLGNRYWSVHNYEGEYLGPIDLVKAIAVSDNSVFSQLTRDVGPSSVVQTAHAAGITGPLQGYFAIGHNNEEFLVQFGLMYEGQAAPSVVYTVITTPGYARRLRDLLDESLRIFDQERESSNGRRLEDYFHRQIDAEGFAEARQRYGLRLHPRAGRLRRRGRAVPRRQRRPGGLRPHPREHGADRRHPQAS